MAQPSRIDKPHDPLIERGRGVRILAKSIYRELSEAGYDDKQIVSLATELLSEVTGKKRRSELPRSA